MLTPKIFIGPMSKNIVDAIIEYTNNNNVPIGIIPSRRQVENTGGYVNNWTTKEFCEYVRSKTKNVLLVRDHGGPSQGYAEDDGLKSFADDCIKDMFDIIHVDVWKKYKNYEDGLIATIEFICNGYFSNPDMCYEVGTEEAIRQTTPEELDNLLSDLWFELPSEIFNKIKYVVIQSGTALKGNENIGTFNQDRLIEMIKVVKKYELISKEHNGDYLTSELVNNKFKNGLDSINIAPEFGQIETRVILNHIKQSKPELFDEFYNICLESKRWVKWVPDDFKPEENKEEVINISGHYVFSEPKFIEIKNKLNNLNLDEEIKTKVKDRITELLKATSNVNK